MRRDRGHCESGTSRWEIRGWTGVSDVSFFLTVTFAIAESAGKFPGKNVFDLFSGFGFE